MLQAASLLILYPQSHWNPGPQTPSPLSPSATGRRVAHFMMSRGRFPPVSHRQAAVAWISTHSPQPWSLRAPLRISWRGHRAEGQRASPWHLAWHAGGTHCLFAPFSQSSPGLPWVPHSHGLQSLWNSRASFPEEPHLCLAHRRHSMNAGGMDPRTDT